MKSTKLNKYFIYFFITTIMFFFISFFVNSFKAYFKKHQSLSFIKKQYKDILVNYKFLKKNSINVTIFKYLITQKIYSNSVIEGKNNWLFYCNKNDGDLIADYKGSNYPTKDEINNHIQVLTKNYEYLKTKKIDFIVFVAPNKGRIYPQYLPDNIETIEKMTTDYVIEQLKNSNLEFPIIYPKNELISLSKKYQLYYSQDTHWNQLGAYIGFKSLLKEGFNTNIPSLETLRIYEKISDSKGDLVNMIKLETYYPYLSEYLIKEFDDVKTDNSYEHINPNPLINKSVLVIRDSFADNLYKYLRKTFSRVLLVSRNDYTTETFDRFKPDVVIFESVGRLFYKEQHKMFFLGNNYKN